MTVPANYGTEYSFVVEPNLNNRAFVGFDGNATKSKIFSDQRMFIVTDLALHSFLKTIYYCWLDTILRLGGLLSRCSNYPIISDLQKVIVIVTVIVIRNSNTMVCLTPQRL